MKTIKSIKSIIKSIRCLLHDKGIIKMPFIKRHGYEFPQRPGLTWEQFCQEADNED